MVLKAENISKEYRRESKESNSFFSFFAVREVNLTLNGGELALLAGRSGSGKTTLINMLAGLISPSSGHILTDDMDLYGLSDDELSRFRNKNIALIPQGETPLYNLSVIENVALPMMLYSDKMSDVNEFFMRKTAQEYLAKFGMENLINAYPAELSGGELRRMAIARALAQKPGVILADEPTGDLDDENTALVMEAFRSAADEGAAVLIVTHETDLIKYADKSYAMSAGELRYKPK